jgi:NAD(P)-dependent dehydrogenase (short-subunit alcohol dehydrogenase family)
VHTVVITGSTRGLGFGLAEAFLALGARVVVSGRSQASVDQATAKLARKHGTDRVRGFVCDSTELSQLEGLYDSAEGAFGPVDLWINNAGTNVAQLPLMNQPAGALAQVVQTNLVGVVLGTRVAVARMAERGGAVYNVDGFGADGRMRRTGMAVYGATKAAVRYFSDSVSAELAHTPIRVGTLSPGIVLTELLLEQVATLPPPERQAARRRYDLLGDTVETVAPWLARQVLAQRTHISWLTLPRLLGRLLWPGSWRRRLLPA